MPEVSGPANFSSAYSNDGSATIVCDGNGGYEPVLNDYATASCGIDQCITEHEQSHAGDWSQRYPDGCSGQPEGAEVPRTGADYDSFLGQSECRAYTAELACQQNLFSHASPACQPIIQEHMEQDLAAQEDSCQASYP